jgi:hypothetical protein
MITNPEMFKNNNVDWSGRGLDSCGNSGKVETPQGKARGSSTHAPRKASPLERKSHYSLYLLLIDSKRNN